MNLSSHTDKKVCKELDVILFQIHMTVEKIADCLTGFEAVKLTITKFQRLAHK